MEKEKKNRSGSQSNHGSNENRGNRYRTDLPGAPEKSNRQTKSDDENPTEKTSGTKKGPNNI